MLDVNWENILRQYNIPQPKGFEISDVDKQSIQDLLATGRPVVFRDKDNNFYNINKEPIDKKPEGAFIFAIEE